MNALKRNDEKRREECNCLLQVALDEISRHQKCSSQEGKTLRPEGLDPKTLDASEKEVINQSIFQNSLFTLISPSGVEEVTRKVFRTGIRRSKTSPTD